MSKTYLLTMRPLEPYFFGNEKTFSFDPKKPEDNRYFIKSERMPLQTTVLGALRYLMMPVKNAGYRYSAEERSRNASVIGTDSFTIDSQGQSFGAIRKLSPVFLIRGQAKYVRTPFDHRSDVADRYAPLVQGPGVNTDRGRCIYFPEFDAKKGIHDSYMDAEDATLEEAKQIFFSTVRVGVNKLRHEKGFYKRQFMGLCDGWAFGAYVTLDDDLIAGDPDAQAALDELKTGTVAYLGQNKSAFSVSLKEEENTLAKAVASHLLEGRVYCFGDTLAKADLYEKCALAVTMLRDYRAYSTKFVETEQASQYVGFVQKDARLYKLLCAGSVLIPFEGQDISSYLYNAQCQRIGFNITISYGEE